jgi:hypothetical protein
MALPKRGDLPFPELNPLGRGAVDTYLCLVNASGRELDTEGSPGLQEIVDEGKFRAPEFGSAQGVPRHIYHVRRESWSLKTRLRSDHRLGVGQSESEQGQARVALADLTCCLRGDGSILGLACYEIEPHTGPFVTIDLPPRSEPLWAALDATAVPLLRASAGRWLIPLTESAEDELQVRLIWEMAPDPTMASQSSWPSHLLPLPSLGQPGVPTFVTVHAPDGFDVMSPNGSFEAVARERLEINRVEWQAKQVSAMLGTLDRGSERACERLVSDLVQFELLERDAERSAFWNMTSPAALREPRIQRAQERVRIARSGLDESLRTAALEEFAESARIHVGLVADDPNTTTLEIPEPTAPVRFRRLGQPRFFQAEPAAGDRSPVLAWMTAARRLPFARPTDWFLLILGLLLLLVLVDRSLTVADRARWVGPTLLTVVLGAVGTLMGPVALGACAAAACLGWLRQAPS